VVTKDPVAPTAQYLMNRDRKAKLIRLFKPLANMYPSLNRGSYVFAGLLVVLPLVTGSFMGPTPLEWRSFASSVTSHHTLILWLYVGLFAWLVHRGVKPILAVGSVFMVLSVHELLWWAFDFAWMMSAGYQVQWYWLFGYLLPPTLGCVMIWPQFLHVPRWLVFSVVAFDVLWFMAGWPVTVNYIGGVYPAGSPLQGLTRWYGTVWGDGWEFMSWLTPVVAFGALELKRLLQGQALLTRALA
jgi:hypothetical protein